MKIIHKRIENQKITLILDYIMWGVAASLLILKEDTECETFYTDAVVIGYNPNFAETMTDLELRFIIAHEVLHVLLGHCFRAMGKNQKVWNEACDYVVNLILCDAGFTMPKQVLYSEQYRDMSADEVYYLLMKKNEGSQSQQSSSKNPSNSSNDDVSSSKSEGDTESTESKESASSAELSEDTNSTGTKESTSSKQWGEIRPNSDSDLRKKWENQSMQAALQAHQRGKLPGSLRRVIREANAPYVDFKSITTNFLQTIAPSEYTWSRPNRNYLQQGFYAPTLRDQKLGHLFFGNDTSGSVTEFQMSCSEKWVKSLMNDCRPESLTVIHSDAAVRSVEKFEIFDDIKLTPIGGGQTNFKPVFEYIEKTGEQPSGLIFLTDLQGIFPDKAPDYPVLWLSTTRDAVAPFGETVFLDLRGE